MVDSLFVRLVKSLSRTIALIGFLLLTGAASSAQESATPFTVTQPEYRKVYQRNSANYAFVPISGSVASNVAAIQARAVVMSGGNGRPTAWKTIASDVVAGSEYSGVLPLEAGGWYQVQVRAGDGGEVTIDKVGVGEVFITAGQSNAGNYGEAPLAAIDDRVSAWKGVDKETWQTLGWRHADDPQPIAAPLSGMRGSPWPAMADILAQRLDVPIGLISVARGGTTVFNWTDFVKDVPFYLIRNALHEVGPTGVRAILWHQGEADTVSNTTPEFYQARLQMIIEESRREAGWTVPWVIAQASFVPWSLLDSTQKLLFLNDESLLNLQAERIVNAQIDFAANGAVPEVYLGPTTNDLTGAGWRWDQLHMTVPGLREHGRRWAQTLLEPGLFNYPTRALTFTQPVNGARLSILSSLRGTVENYFDSPETTPGTVRGNASVRLAVQRLSDGKYWDTTTSNWSSAAATLTANVSGNFWANNQKLPSGSNLLPGDYRLIATATQTPLNDTDAQPQHETTSIVVTIAPSSVRIITPANNTTHCIITPAVGAPYTPLSAATGTAFDNVGGNTVSRVTLRLRRTLPDNSTTYWGGGNNWHATYETTTHERPAAGTANWSLQLPTLADGFVAARYNLRATATTASGASFTTESNFTVTNVYTIQGRITTMNSSGTPVGLPDVIVTRNGIVPDGGVATAVTNAAGYYTFTLVPDGVTYTLTPALPGRVFVPVVATAMVHGGNTTGPSFHTGYSISGRVTNGGNGVEGAVITRSGAENGSPVSVLTDASGNYRLVNVPSGAFVVTPSKSSHLFAPIAGSVTVTNSNINNFNFASIFGTILSGRVTTSRGVAISGVTLTRSGAIFPGLGLSTQSDNNGYYTFNYVAAGTYNITPAKAGYRFTAVARSVIVSGAPVSGQNFIGVFNYGISGRLTDKSGAGIANIAVRCTGVLGAPSISVSTNSAGYYTFNELPNGTYTIAPIVSNLALTPEARTVTINGADAVNQNFVAAPGFRISGRISTSSGVAIAGVSVMRSGSSTAVFTNNAGYYTFINVPNGTFTITPSLAGKVFTPVAKTTTLNNGDVAGQNFIGTPAFLNW